MSHLFDDEYDDSRRYERFITTIQQRAAVSLARGRGAADATLATLSERISSGAGDRVAQPWASAESGSSATGTTFGDGQENAMRAIIQDKYGSPGVLEIRDVGRPVVKDDEILVRVRA